MNFVFEFSGFALLCDNVQVCETKHSAVCSDIVIKTKKKKRKHITRKMFYYSNVI